MFTMTRMAATLLLASLLAAPLDPLPSWTYTGHAPGVLLGHAVAGLGDVNGDGFDDVAVGMLDFVEPYPGEEPSRGLTFVFLGGRTGLSLTPAWNFPQGGTPTTARDVNGDGFNDLFIRNHDSKAFVFHGSADGLISPPATTIFPDLVVQTIVGLGDTTGDGFGDAALINAPPTGTKLNLFMGSATGINPTATLVLGIDNLVDLAAAGDVNGDGLADLVFSTGTNLDDGRVAVFPGQLGGFGSTEMWSSTGDGQGGFGSRIAGAGDVDGDGFDDILVTAPFFTSTPDEEGKVYLFRGSASGPSLTPSWTFAAGGLLVNARIASAGDVNGDGFSDVAVSSGTDAPSAGVVLLFLGSAAGLSSAPDQVLSGDAEAVTFGWALASAGDVDGDGASDLLVGDPFAHGDAGKASLFRGQAPAVLAPAGAKAGGGAGGCGALGAEAGLLMVAAAFLRRRRRSADATSA